jgi:HK97 gp10 family phage protein
MMEFETKLTGFKELAEALRELPQNVGRNVLRSAVGAGAAEIRKEAKKNAEGMRDTGTLARAIYQKQIPEQSSLQKQVFYVGARQGKQFQKMGKKGINKDAFYARFVELGHFSRPTTGGNIRVRAGARGREAELNRLSAAGHIHWVPAHPFLRPAFDVKKDAAVTVMGAKIADRLTKIKVRK